MALIAAEEIPRPKLVREFKRNTPQLVDISKDGRLLLLMGQRSTKCEFKEGCVTPALTVYEVASGRMIDEITDLFSAPQFEGSSVRTARKQRLNDQFEDVLWEPGARETVLGKLAPPGLNLDSCRSDSGIVSVGSTTVLASLQGAVKLVAPQIGDRSSFAKHCNSWRTASTFLLKGEKSDETLYWVPNQPNEAFRECRSFAPETVLGHAIAPDGSIVAVITGAGKSPESPGYITHLNVLASKDCSVLKRTPLKLSEQPERRKQILPPREEYWNSVPFDSEFMAYIAIAPNKRLLAVAYGIWRDPYAIGKVSFYSLQSGEQLGTIDTGSQRCAIVRHMNSNWCETPPVGPIQFSPDSRFLFTSSLNVQQWDVSKLQ